MAQNKKIKSEAEVKKTKQTRKGKDNKPLPKTDMLLNSIKLLLRKQPEMSASQVAKKLHIRKQTALNMVREIKNIPKNTKKVTYHKPTPVTLDNIDMIIRLYKEGYPKNLIQKIMSKKYKISYRQTSQLIKEQTTDADIETRKKYQKCNRKQPKQWLKNHYDGALYRYARHHYNKNYNWDNEEYEKLYTQDEIADKREQCLNGEVLKENYTAEPDEDDYDPEEDY